VTPSLIPGCVECPKTDYFVGGMMLGAGGLLVFQVLVALLFVRWVKDSAARWLNGIR
jgi:hypothetical protein